MSWAWLKAARNSRARELTALAEVMNAPLPVRRRVAFIAAAECCGATTLTVEVARMLTRQWTSRLLLVTGTEPTSPGYRWPPAVRRLPPQLWDDPIGHWDVTVRDAIDDHDLTITDWGAVPLAYVRGLAQHSHAVCLVASAQRDIIQAALDVGWELAKNHPVRLAIVDAAGEAAPCIDDLAANLPLPTTYLRHSRTLRHARPPRLSEPESLAVYHLAAGLIGDLTGPWERAA